MQICVTSKRVVTRLTKPELSKIKQVQLMMEHLAAHQPLIPDYRAAADGLKAALEIFGDSRDPC